MRGDEQEHRYQQANEEVHEGFEQVRDLRSEKGEHCYSLLWVETRDMGREDFVL